MPYRDWYLPTSPYDIGFDRFGDWHDDRAQMREANPRGGEDEPRRLLRCPMCGKDLAARETCAACGDETGTVVHPDARAIVRWAFEDPQDRRDDAA